MVYAASEVILKVRDLISDSVSPHRWLYATMLDWINEAIAALFDNHPEVFYTTSIRTTPPASVTGEGDLIDTTITGQKMIINYVAYRCMLRDSEDPENLKQATQFLELYSLGV